MGLKTPSLKSCDIPALASTYYNYDQLSQFDYILQLQIHNCSILFPSDKVMEWWSVSLHKCRTFLNLRYNEPLAVTKYLSTFLQKVLVMVHCTNSGVAENIELHRLSCFLPEQWTALGGVPPPPPLKARGHIFLIWSKLKSNS